MVIYFLWLGLLFFFLSLFFNSRLRVRNEIVVGGYFFAFACVLILSSVLMLLQIQSIFVCQFGGKKSDNFPRTSVQMLPLTAAAAAVMSISGSGPINFMRLFFIDQTMNAIILHHHEWKHHYDEFSLQIRPPTTRMRFLFSVFCAVVVVEDFLNHVLLPIDTA